MVPRWEPTIVEHKALYADSSGFTRQRNQHFGAMIKINGLPCIEVHRAWAHLATWPLHPATRTSVKCLGNTVQAVR
jgi:hypothetical protein